MQKDRPRVGVFGGTFDPPHVGHLVVAVNVRHDLALDRVLFVVANEPWQKVGERAITPALDRLAMVEAAVHGVEGLEASRVDIDRGGPSYSVDTLRDLQGMLPEAELFLIMGRDAALGIGSWERAEDLPSMATMVVVERPGADAGSLPAGYRWRCIESPRLEVSSSDLRDRVVDGRPLDFLLTPAVVSCIRQRGLYGLARNG